MSESLALIFAIALLSTVGQVGPIASGLGEEIGWRGFLVPELAKMYGVRWAGLLSGVVWVVWHAPILIFADYNSGTPWWYGLTCFAIGAIGIGYAFTWLRMASRSLWPAAVLHGSHNLFIQGVFDELTADTGLTPWVTGEFGAAFAVVGALVGGYYWRKCGSFGSESAGRFSE